MSYFVYVLQSQKTGKQYIGYTSKNLEQRLDWHKQGLTAWTKQNNPFELIYSEKYSDKAIAMRRERFFKTGNGRLALQNLMRAHSSVG